MRICIGNIDVKVSIIVPVFNVELYLKDCIESVINQTYSKWELILVDDGSTDNTLEICKNFAVADIRIKVFHKENGGVSSARNYGLKMAVGEWISFIDADDWIEANTLEVAINYILKENLDVIGWNNYFSTNQKEVKEQAINPPKLIRSEKDLNWFLIDTMFPLYDKWVNEVSTSAIRCVWSKMFKASLIKSNNIYFNENLFIGEDSLFCFDCIFQAERMMIVNEYLTHYRIHESSVMRSGFKSKMDENNKILMQEFHKRITNKNLIDQIFQSGYMGLAMSCLNRSVENYFNNNLYNKRNILSNIQILLDMPEYEQAFDFCINNRFPLIFKLYALFAKNKYFRMIFMLKQIDYVVKNCIYNRR